MEGVLLARVDSFSPGAPVGSLGNSGLSVHCTDGRELHMWHTLLVSSTLLHSIFEVMCKGKA